MLKEKSDLQRVQDILKKENILKLDALNKRLITFNKRSFHINRSTQYEASNFSKDHNWALELKLPIMPNETPKKQL